MHSQNRLAVAILLSMGAFAMAAGGGAADGHVGGPGIPT